MDTSIEVITQTRKKFLELMEGLSLEQLNEIPTGFNNNIIWNLGHVIASLQVICYKLAELPYRIDSKYIPKYQKGTKPESFIDEEEFDVLKRLAVSTIEDLVRDFKNGLFKKHITYETQFGVPLSYVEDSIIYMAMHEGLHLGYAMALKRVITK